MDITAKIVLVIALTNVGLSALAQVLDLLKVKSPPWLQAALGAIRHALDMLSANPAHKQVEPPKAE